MFFSIEIEESLLTINMPVVSEGNIHEIIVFVDEYCEIVKLEKSVFLNGFGHPVKKRKLKRIKTKIKY